MAAAEHEEGEEEEEEDPDFPEELDEFLHYCVGERGGDFEAVSADFLDIAADLEENLAQKAKDRFSPEALRRRWLLLTEGDAAAAAPAAAEALPPGGGAEDGPAAALDPAAAPVPQQPQLQQPQQPPPPPRVHAPLLDPVTAAVAAAAGVDPLEPVPSDFSIFKDSLKCQIERIYLDVQNHLPSVATPEEEEPDSDGEPALQEGAGGASSSDSAAPAVGAPGAPAAGGVASGGQPEEAAPPLEFDSTSESEELRQRTIKLFGTDNLNQILLEMPEAAGGGPAAAGPPGPAHSSAAPAAAAPSTSPSAEPSRRPPPTEARPARPAAPPPADAAARRAAPPFKGRPVARGDAGLHGAGEELEPPAEESDAASVDSIDEDFAATRRAMKTGSLGLAGGGGGAAPGVPPAPFAPPPRQRPPPQQQQQGRPPQPAAGAGPAVGAARPPQNFVRLELLESSEEDDEAGEADDESDAEEDGDRGEEEVEEDEAIRVIAQLLRQAPTGECPWDTWLGLSRRWPRLRLKLDSAEFFRRGGDLRLRFDLGQLGAIREEQQLLREERLRSRREYEERLQRGPAEFIAETERRRALMGKRFGGFVLTSSLQQKRQQAAEEAARAAALKEPDGGGGGGPAPQPGG